jgi:hypothetical protein
MAMNVRRIVTGHNAAGKAVVKTDEQITYFTVPGFPPSSSTTHQERKPPSSTRA